MDKEVKSLTHFENRKLYYLLPLVLVTIAWIFFGWLRNSPQKNNNEDRPSNTTVRVAPNKENQNNRATKRKSELDIEQIDPISSIRSPDDALMLLDRLKNEQSNLEFRALDSARTICALVESGYPNEAWQMIDDAPGMVRNKQISWFMGMEIIPVEKRIELMNGLGKNESRSALRSMIYEMTPSQLLSFASEKSALVDPKLADTSKQFFENRLQNYINNTAEIGESDANQRIKDALRDAESLLRLNQISPAVYASILNEHSGLSAFEKWDHFEAIAAHPSNKSGIKTLMEQAVDPMISENAPRAMEILIDDKSRVYNPSNLKEGIRIWYRDDSTGANKWMVENLSKLRGDQHDVIVAEVAKIALKDSNRETAIQWANSIKDPKLRQSIIKLAQ